MSLVDVAKKKVSEGELHEHIENLGISDEELDELNALLNADRPSAIPNTTYLAAGIVIGYGLAEEKNGQ